MLYTQSLIKRTMSQTGSYTMTTRFLASRSRYNTKIDTYTQKTWLYTGVLYLPIRCNDHYSWVLDTQHLSGQAAILLKYYKSTVLEHQQVYPQMDTFWSWCWGWLSIRSRRQL